MPFFPDEDDEDGYYYWYGDADEDEEEKEDDESEDFGEDDDAGSRLRAANLSFPLVRVSGNNLRFVDATGFPGGSTGSPKTASFKPSRGRAADRRRTSLRRAATLFPSNPGKDAK